MRNSKGQFRSRKPTTEEAKAMMTLVQGGWLKLVVSAGIGGDKNG